MSVFTCDPPASLDRAAVRIAADTDLAVDTVRRVLRGRRCRPSTLRAVREAAARLGLTAFLAARESPDPKAKP